jgi:hypothetical protein
MKERYRYISFGRRISKTKTAVYACHNNSSGAEVGIVKWYGPWRQYCFFPARGTIFSKGCMEDVNDFIRQLMEERGRRAKEE